MSLTICLSLFVVIHFPICFLLAKQKISLRDISYYRCENKYPDFIMISWLSLYIQYIGIEFIWTSHKTGRNARFTEHFSPVSWRVQINSIFFGNDLCIVFILQSLNSVFWLKIAQNRCCRFHQIWRETVARDVP